MYAIVFACVHKCTPIKIRVLEHIGLLKPGSTLLGIHLPRLDVLLSCKATEVHL